MPPLACRSGGVRHGLFALALASLLLLPGPRLAAEEPPVAPPVPLRVDEFGEPEPPQAIRERLTEREDEIFVEDPWSTEVLGRPLTFSGEAEVVADFLRRRSLGADPRRSRELALEAEVEAELFYTLGSDVYAFLQGAVGWERLVHAAAGTHQRETAFLERGESWVVFRNLLGRRLHLEVGSLDFEDDRTWWWDEDLDAVRLEWETGLVDLELSVARELTPRRTDLDGIDPEQEGVLRLLGELSFEWAEHHALEVFALRQSDHSRTEQVGTEIDLDREDDSDASLFWIGPRAVGGFESAARGTLGYWLDAALVCGRELALEVEEISSHRGEVEERTRRRVRGVALDAGLTWVLPWRLEPRVTLAFAQGSGDSSPDSGTDRSFHQTGIEGNEAAFGGVERFPRYGSLLDPELSNLRVATVGLGISLLRSSSLDLVLHDYRLVEPADALRDARLDLELAGSRHVGSGADLVLALEEWKRFQATFIGSIFRGGSAVAERQEHWTYGGFVSLRFAF